MVTKKEKEVRYEVSIRYRDGGVDKYYGIKTISVNGNVLEIVDANNIFIGIVLDIVSYYNVEEA